MSLPRNDMFQSDAVSVSLSSSEYIEKIRRQWGYVRVNNPSDNSHSDNNNNDINDRFVYDASAHKLVWVGGYNKYYELLYGYRNTLIRESQLDATSARDNSNCLLGYMSTSDADVSVKKALDYKKSYKKGWKYDASGNKMYEVKRIDCEELKYDDITQKLFDSAENGYAFTGAKFMVNAKYVKKIE